MAENEKQTENQTTENQAGIAPLQIQPRLPLKGQPAAHTRQRGRQSQGHEEQGLKGSPALGNSPGPIPTEWLQLVYNVVFPLDLRQNSTYTGTRY